MKLQIIWTRLLSLGFPYCHLNQLRLCALAATIFDSLWLSASVAKRTRRWRHVSKWSLDKGAPKFEQTTCSGLPLHFRLFLQLGRQHYFVCSYFFYFYHGYHKISIKNYNKNPSLFELRFKPWSLKSSISPRQPRTSESRHEAEWYNLFIFLLRTTALLTMYETKYSLCDWQLLSKATANKRITRS